GATGGLAVAVDGGAPVTQALLALIEPEGAGHALVLRRRTGAADTELKRQTLGALAGSVDLSIVAFDDSVRATVGEISLTVDRDAARTGRLALVAEGPCKF